MGEEHSEEEGEIVLYVRDAGALRTNKQQRRKMVKTRGSGRTRRDFGPIGASEESPHYVIPFQAINKLLYVCYIWLTHRLRTEGKPVQWGNLSSRLYEDMSTLKQVDTWLRYTLSYMYANMLIVILSIGVFLNDICVTCAV